MKILVVEDEAKTARFLRTGLREAGFVVDEASDGQEAIHMAGELSFDVIVLDVMLPKADGWQVLAELRREGPSGESGPFLPHLPLPGFSIITSSSFISREVLFLWISRKIEIHFRATKLLQTDVGGGRARAFLFIEL